MENQRNVILAIGLMALVLFGWPYALEVFYPARPATIEDAVEAPRPGLKNSNAVPDTGTAPKVIRERKAVIAGSARIPIDAPRVAGSINLTGARLDDLVLKDYREKLDKNSDRVHLFSPAGTEDQYFAQFGWIGEESPSPPARPYGPPMAPS